MVKLPISVNVESNRYQAKMLWATAIMQNFKYDSLAKMSTTSENSCKQTLQITQLNQCICFLISLLRILFHLFVTALINYVTYTQFLHPFEPRLQQFFIKTIRILITFEHFTVTTTTTSV